MPLLNCSYQVARLFGAAINVFHEGGNKKNPSPPCGFWSPSQPWFGLVTQQTLSRADYRKLLWFQLKQAWGGEGKKRVEVRQKTAARRLMNGPHLQC